MAGRQRQPIDLILEKGRKHLTKDEIEQRRNSEVKVEYTNVKPPSYLSKKQKADFINISKILVDTGIMSELDEDCLARYLIARDTYVRYTKKLNIEFRQQNAKENKDNKEKQSDIAKNIDTYLIYQDRAFKQCRASASDLGLSISSRCRLIMPKEKEEPKKNKFAKFKVV